MMFNLQNREKKSFSDKELNLLLSFQVEVFSNDLVSSSGFPKADAKSIFKEVVQKTNWDKDTKKQPSNHYDSNLTFYFGKEGTTVRWDITRFRKIPFGKRESVTQLVSVTKTDPVLAITRDGRGIGIYRGITEAGKRKPYAIKEYIIRLGQQGTKPFYTGKPIDTVTKTILKTKSLFEVAAKKTIPKAQQLPKVVPITKPSKAYLSIGKVLKMRLKEGDLAIPKTEVKEDQEEITPRSVVQIYSSYKFWLQLLQLIAVFKGL